MTCSTLSAIIAAVAVMKNIRKSRLANDVKARCPVRGGRRGAMVSELNCLRCLDRRDVGTHCIGIRGRPVRCRRICCRVRGRIDNDNEDFMRGLLLVLACVAALPAFADEGMWTFDNFPSG